MKITLALLLIFMSIPAMALNELTTLLTWKYGNPTCHEEFTIMTDGNVTHAKICYDGRSEMPSIQASVTELADLKSLISRAAVGQLKKSSLGATLGDISGRLLGYVGRQTVVLRDYDRQNLSNGTLIINQADEARQLESFIVKKWGVNLPPIKP